MQPSTSRGARGPAALVFLYLLPLLLAWPELRNLFDGARVTTRSLANIAAVLGLTGFALNIILGARLPRLHRLVGGLEGLYSLHRMNGRFAYILIAAHVVLVLTDRAMGSIASAVRLLTPAAGAVIFLGVVAFVTMTAAMVATLYLRLTHEMFVYVQRGFGAVFVVGALHAFTTPGLKADSSGLTIYLAVLAAAAFAAFVYRSLLGNLLVRRFDYVVTRATELDPEVMEIQMEPVDRPLVAKPGQFVFVTFYSDRFNARFHPVSFVPHGESAVIALRPGETREQFHPFSLTSAPGDPRLSLVVKAVGTFTRALHSLEPGAAARVEGPYGEFSYLDVKSRHQVWIAGGIGITPFLSMARSLEVEAGYDIELYWGVSSRAQAYFADELEEIAGRVPGFRVTIVPEDEQGFITAELVDAHHDLRDIEVLLVGPPAMERALRTQLTAAGVPDRRIHSERFAFGPRD